MGICILTPGSDLTPGSILTSGSGVGLPTFGSGLIVIACHWKTQTDVVCPQNGEMMEEGIDLRGYINVLLHHWKWIAGLALVAAVAAFAISSLLPAMYKASSVVIVTQPRYQMQFDPRFETSQGWGPAYKVFPTLATSDGVLQTVVDAYDMNTTKAEIREWRLSVLSDMVEAFSGGDPSLVVLAVQSRSPQDAAAIANLWADILTQKGNEIYGESEKDVAFFEEQVDQAARTLDAADAALIEFEARNQSGIVGAQLDSRQRAQADYLASQRTIASIVQDVQGLRHQSAEQTGYQAVSLADSLTALLLQIKAFDAQSDAPIELQIGGSESLSNKSLEEQVAFLDDLVATLQVKSADIEMLLEELEPEILALQQKLQESSVEQDRLTRDHTLARETYLTLARKLDEARIAAQEENGVLQVGSYAAVPEEAIGPRKQFNTVVAGMLGLMIGIVIAFFVEFWRHDGAQVADRDRTEGAEG